MEVADDDKRVLMEVAGQDEEFRSDVEESGSDGQSDLVSDDEDVNDENVRGELSNNNAVISTPKSKKKQPKNYEQEEGGRERDSKGKNTGRSRSRSKGQNHRERDINEDTDDEEDMMFKRFDHYLKKKGFKITKIGESVQDERDSNQRKEINHGGEFEDQSINDLVKLGSVTTIYKPTVEKLSEKNRLSSSSEEGEGLLSKRGDDPELIYDLINHFIGSQRTRVIDG